jgi:ABC-type Fe3+ transport system permease subunit
MNRENIEDQSDIDNEDEESLLKLCNVSIWEDLWNSVYDARFAGPLVALLGVIIAFHITIAPYRVHVEHHEEINTLNLDLVQH